MKRRGVGEGREGASGASWEPRAHLLGKGLAGTQAKPRPTPHPPTPGTSKQARLAHPLKKALAALCHVRKPMDTDPQPHRRTWARWRWCLGTGHSPNSGGRIPALLSCPWPSYSSEIGPGHHPRRMVLGSPPGPGRGLSRPLPPVSFIWEVTRRWPPQRGPRGRAGAPGRSGSWGPAVPSVHRLIPAPSRGPGAGLGGARGP